MSKNSFLCSHLFLSSFVSKTLAVVSSTFNSLTSLFRHGLHCSLPRAKKIFVSFSCIIDGNAKKSLWLYFHQKPLELETLDLIEKCFVTLPLELQKFCCFFGLLVICVIWHADFIRKSLCWEYRCFSFLSSIYSLLSGVKGFIGCRANHSPKFFQLYQSTATSTRWCDFPPCRVRLK